MRPDLTIRMGFLWPTRLAISVNLRGLPKDSRYIQITWVAGSSSQYSSMSLPEMSALVAHRDEHRVKPMPSLRGVGQDRLAQRAGLTDDEADRFRVGAPSPAANVALSRTVGLRIDHAHAVGPDHGNAGGAHGIAQLAFHLRSLFAGLGVSCGDDDETLYIAFDALFDDAHDSPPRHHDDHEIHRIGNRGQAG